MKVITAKTAGFCFGVERAVREALSAAKNSTSVYTYGPIVHNETVIGELSEKGVRTIRDESGLSEIPAGSTVLIRAHGVPKELEQKIRDAGFQVIDATCPFVRKIHRIAEKYASEACRVIIAGNPNHPEVVGIRSYAGEKASVIDSPDDLPALNIGPDEKICLVAQTTFNHEKFKKIVAKIRDLGYNANIADTVCSATRERQEEAADLASRADVMIVIGGRESSNSQKLYEICRKNCNRTYFIQTAADLCNDWWCGVNIVGITAGASTPKTIIQEVQTNVRKF